MTMRETPALQTAKPVRRSGNGYSARELVSKLRSSTRELHSVAERSGIVRELLLGRGSVASYALLLRNLLPVYRAMEAELSARKVARELGCLADVRLHRADAIAADLNVLTGSRWRRTLPVLPAAKRYSERVRLIGSTDRSRVLGHAYTRYLGDLSGGQILKCLLGRTLSLSSDSLNFYEFPGIGNIDEFKAHYLRALDAYGDRQEQIDAIVDEAVVAFRCNIELSDAVLAADTGMTPRSLSR